MAVDAIGKLFVQLLNVDVCGNKGSTGYRLAVSLIFKDRILPITAVGENWMADADPVNISDEFELRSSK